MGMRRFFQQAHFYYKGRRAAFSTEEFLLLQVGYPIITLFFYCFVASFSFGTTDLSHWVVGNAFLLCTNACIFNLGVTFIGERYNGRLRSIVAAPCNKFWLIVANGFYPAITAIVTSTIGMIVGALVFKVDFTKVNLLLVAIAIICAMFVASGFGLLLAVFGLITDNIHLLLNTMSILLMIFSGAEFPVENLPTVLRGISWAFPLTKSIKAIESLFEGNVNSFRMLLAGEIFTGIAYVTLARLLFGWAERKARISGTLDMY